MLILFCVCVAEDLQFLYCLVALIEIHVCAVYYPLFFPQVDYHGNPRTSGGDPVTVDVLPLGDHGIAPAVLDFQIEDAEDGTYRIKFRSPAAGRYMLKLSVFERPIKDCPLFFDVTEHNNPTAVYGSRGSGKDEFLQPVAIAFDETDGGTVYVVDTGNSRIKVRDYRNI